MPGIGFPALQQSHNPPGKSRSMNDRQVQAKKKGEITAARGRASVSLLGVRQVVLSQGLDCLSTETLSQTSWKSAKAYKIHTRAAIVAEPKNFPLQQWVDLGLPYLAGMA